MQISNGVTITFKLFSSYYFFFCRSTLSKENSSTNLFCIVFTNTIHFFTTFFHICGSDFCYNFFFFWKPLSRTHICKRVKLVNYKSMAQPTTRVVGSSAMIDFVTESLMREEKRCKAPTTRHAYEPDLAVAVRTGISIKPLFHIKKYTLQTALQQYLIIYACKITRQRRRPQSPLIDARGSHIRYV